jgi:hypothetical protein
LDVGDFGRGKIGGWMGWRRLWGRGKEAVKVGSEEGDRLVLLFPPLLFIYFFQRLGREDYDEKEGEGANDGVLFREKRREGEEEGRRW